MINFRVSFIRGEWKFFPALFFKLEKISPDFGRKCLDCVYLWVESFIQNVVLKVSWRKISKFFPVRAFFLVLYNVYYGIIIPRNLPCPEKFLATALNVGKSNFIKFVTEL